MSTCILIIMVSPIFYLELFSLGHNGDARLLALATLCNGNYMFGCCREGLLFSILRHAWNHTNAHRLPSMQPAIATIPR